MQDQVCLSAHSTQNDKQCAPLQFLSAYSFEGLEYADGILGISPVKQGTAPEKHFLEQLKKTGVISKSIISFSIAPKGTKEASYAILGGYNRT